mmetsp:Transcript_19195/g.48262  ORF Transcript_19195/g.48262 Transcript_19195/m.48262 type:complete len:275 (-) Transcript_19195:14-838(-)
MRSWTGPALCTATFCAFLFHGASAFTLSPALSLKPTWGAAVSLRPGGVSAMKTRSGGGAKAAKMQVEVSGINLMPVPLQAGIFFGLWVGIYAASRVVAGPVMDAAAAALPAGWFDGISKTWPLLGVLYMLAGSAHFTSKEGFENIYPPMGTWGVWFLPGSAEFHVVWTGVVECVAGAGLTLGGIAALFPALQGVLPGSLLANSALALFVLTTAVTPANIYMYTHNAALTGMGPPGDIPVTFHYIRLTVQVFVLAVLWRMASSEGLLLEAAKKLL